MRLLNDLAATGYAVSTLGKEQLEVLQVGEPDLAGNAALLAPGTGLGEALLRRVPDGHVPIPTEARHGDFAARTPRELELVQTLTAQRGRVSYEDVLTGPGLLNLHRFVHGSSSSRGCPASAMSASTTERPAVITAAGLERTCELCVETLDLFVGALGAEAGNLGLRYLATGGVYLGGGIPRKILPALQTSTFLDAFRSKGPMRHLVERMPVHVIMEPDTAVLGSALVAQQMWADPSTVV